MAAAEETPQHPCIACPEFPSMMCRAKCPEYDAWPVREEQKEREKANAATR